MRKQTVILTSWLALPFLCITFILIWIFITLDKDRLMQDAPPVGAGAGDTGNANALGQWLARRDPDAISKANQARRESTPINPFGWPGGVELIFTHSPDTQATSDSIQSSKLKARIILVAGDTTSILFRHPVRLGDDQWAITLDPRTTPVESAHIAVGYPTSTIRSDDWPLAPIPLHNIHPAETLASDPITIELRIHVVVP